MLLTHRLSLQYKLGRQLSDSEDARHVCPNRSNPLCYNPNHLLEGTHRDNMEDLVKEGRSGKGKRNSQAKLTDEEVISIRAQRDTFTLRELSEMYSVDQALVSLIANNKIWTHLNDNK